MLRYKVRKSGHRTVVTDRVTPIQLRQQVAERAGITEVEATNLIAALSEVITDCLTAGHSVGVAGLGTFTPRLVANDEVSTLFRTTGPLRRLACGIKEITHEQE